MLKKAEQWAEERDGVTLDDILLKCAYGETDAEWKLTMRDRIACIKIWKEFTMTRVQEKNINYTEKKDAVLGLPQRRNDPAKIIPIDGGISRAT